MWSTSFISHKCSIGVLVGLRTQVEPDRGLNYDDTSLNNVEFICQII